jgi:hypothetical protein
MPEGSLVWIAALAMLTQCAPSPSAQSQPKVERDASAQTPPSAAPAASATQPEESVDAGAPLPGLDPIRGTIGMRFEEELEEDGPHVVLRLGSAPSCADIATRVARPRGRVEVFVDGTRDWPASRCLMKQRPPARAEIDLTDDTTARRLVLTTPTGSEAFAIEITADRISIEPEAELHQFALGKHGAMLRTPKNALWVEVTFSGESARLRYADKMTALTTEIEALGAKRFVPRAGRYANDYNAWHALESDAQPSKLTTRFYYIYDGGFDGVKSVGAKYKAFDPPPAPGVESMSIHFGDARGHFYNTR